MRAAGWATFFGPLTPLFYALKNPQKQVNPYTEDKGKEFNKQKQIKNEQIKTSLISSALTLPVNIAYACIAIEPSIKFIKAIKNELNKKTPNKSKILNSFLELAEKTNKIFKFKIIGATLLQLGFWGYTASQKPKTTETDKA